MVNKKTLLAPGLLAALSIIWGTSFILIKRGLSVFSSEEVALIRVVAAFFFLLPFALRRMHKLTLNDHLKLIASGLMGIFIPSFLFATAQTHLDSSITGILNSLTPMWVIVIGVIVCPQRLSKYTVMGIIIGSAGVAILAGLGSQNISDISTPHILMLVGATFLYGCNLNFVKYKMEKINTLTMTSVSLFIIGSLSSVYLLGFTEFTTKLTSKAGAWPAFGAVVTLGLMSTAVAVLLLNYLIKLTSPVYTSLVTYLIPIVAVTLGILDGEKPPETTYAGLVAIVLGIYLSNKHATPAKRS